MKTLKFLFLLFLLEGLALAAPSGPVLFQNPDGSVSLQWDANTETDLAGYKVYWGQTSRTYGPPVTLGKVTTFTTPKLANGTWFFAVTAYNTGGMESGYSNEVSCAISMPPAPPANLKIIRPPDVTVVARKGVEINWATSVPATTKLFVGRSDMKTITIEDLTLRLEHSVGISGLNPNQTYRFEAESRANGQVDTATGSFVTK